MTIPQYGILERSFPHAGDPTNPYTEISATVHLSEPGGERTRQLPLFWDGGRAWRFRFSPDRVGRWRWATHSSDDGLDGHSGTFEVVPSDLKGSIRPMTGHPHHFERQDGSRFWYLGDTAWSLYVDNAETGHDRAAAEHHLDVRASQGFNVVHSMLLHEEGWINTGGPPFDSLGEIAQHLVCIRARGAGAALGEVAQHLAALSEERINPAYWQEVDRRLAYANGAGIIAGLVLAWGRKQWDDTEPYAWDRFPTLAAKLRYARYVAARYSAYDVYFIVAGEWNASGRDRGDLGVRQEYIEIGDALAAADPHGRMIGIHPGTHGNHFVREFSGFAQHPGPGGVAQHPVSIRPAPSWPGRDRGGTGVARGVGGSVRQPLRGPLDFSTEHLVPGSTPVRNI